MAISTLLASASLAHAQSWTGWHAEAWANLRLTNTETVAMAAVVNGPFALTNYLAPYPSTNSTTNLITFLSDIEPLPADPTPITNLWTFNVYNSGGTNVAETRTNIAAQVATNLQLQARDVLALDAYLAAAERYNIVTNGTLEKPRYYRGYRDALVGYKEWLSDNASDFVDSSLIGTNGHYDAHFETVTEFEWVTDVRVDELSSDPCDTNRWSITTNSYWRASQYPSTFPMLSRNKLAGLPGMPYNHGVVTTRTYTADVPGWFACDTNTYVVIGHTFTVATTGAHTRTWFDYTPYRSLGGWGQGLSNQIAGSWRFDLSAYWRPQTQTWAIIDTVASPYMVKFDPSTNALGVVTQGIFSIYRHWLVATNNFPVSTNNVVVTSPCLTGSITPSITITVTNAAYTTVTTNYSASISLTNGTTNIIFSQAYTSPVAITNSFAAELDLIATNSTEAEYGYAKLQAVVSNLLWTANYEPPEAKTNATYRGKWEECQTDPDPDPALAWRHTETNAYLWPFASKYAAERVSIEPPIDACSSNPPVDTCNESETFAILEPGCYLATRSGYTVDVASDCFADAPPLFSDQYIVTVTNAAAYRATFSSCCFIDPWYYWIKEWITYSPIPCPPDGGGELFTCGYVSPSTNDPVIVYSYYRNAQSLAWTNTAMVSSSADIYFRASNPSDLQGQPDSEGFFTNELRKTYAFYSSVSGSNSTIEVTDFHTSEKPWASTNLEIRAWQLNGSALLMRWGFEYR